MPKIKYHEIKLSNYFTKEELKEKILAIPSKEKNIAFPRRILFDEFNVMISNDEAIECFKLLKEKKGFCRICKSEKRNNYLSLKKDVQRPLFSQSYHIASCLF